MTWEQALSYCEKLNLGRLYGLAVAHQKELRSLVDFSRYNPAINTTYFPDTFSSFYWSSTTFRAIRLRTWGVEFCTATTPATD